MTLNPQIVCTAFGTLPPNFEEQVADWLTYTMDGESAVVFRSDLYTSPFEQHEIGRELAAFFIAHPDQDYIILQPS